VKTARQTEIAMHPLVDLNKAIESGDEHGVYRAMYACRVRLREGADDGALEAALIPLATHKSTTVRQGVADACDSFAEPFFEEIHARLLADRDFYVRGAAKAAGDRRAQQRRRRAKVVAEEQAFGEILAEIERRHGKGARKLAERAAERGVENFAKLLDHETRKTKNAIHISLAQLASELDRPERSVGLLKEQLGVLRERSAFVFSIVLRAREYVTRVKPVFAEEPLARIVHEARAQLLDRMGKRASKVSLSVDIDRELRVEVDRHALLQALQNVLENAVEAYDVAADPIRVRIAARTLLGGSEVELSVADDGVGMETERIPSLFVPFGSRKPGGTGVGLLIVRRVVEQIHGGALDLTSAPGKGTTVTMIFPTRQSP